MRSPRLPIVFVDDGRPDSLYMILEAIKGESTFGVTSVNLKITDPAGSGGGVA